MTCVAQHLAQRRVQQVGGGVVGHRRPAPLLVDLRPHAVALRRARRAPGGPRSPGRRPRGSRRSTAARAAPTRSSRDPRPGRRPRRRTATRAASASSRPSPAGRSAPICVRHVERLVAHEIGREAGLAGEDARLVGRRGRAIAARARTRCSPSARANPASSTAAAMLRGDLGGQLEREAVGVVEPEGLLGATRRRRRPSTWSSRPPPALQRAREPRFLADQRLGDLDAALLGSSG